MIIIDANVLLYAYDETDPRHAAAAAWLEATIDGDQDVGLALSTLLAFVRISTDPRVYEAPLGVAAAVDMVESWLRRGNVRILEPTETHWRTLAELATAGQARGAMVMDAHLAALTVGSGGTLATTDRDFSRFPGLRTVDPTAA
jgi:toxin-antitoxin system PIN domain toxin